ncbi:unnamed protein product [Rhodiola kirilowii]
MVHAGSRTWDALLASDLVDEIGDVLATGHDYLKNAQCCLRLSMLPSEIVGEKMDPEKLYDTVHLLLYLHSKNGGFSPWERAGASEWFEVLNPTDFFENVVVDHEYVECTASAIQALVLFKELYPGHRKNEIEVCITKALQYIEDNQRPDGSWYGSWGICFTYCTWFALRGLAAGGQTCKNFTTVRKGVEFLLSKQLENGGICDLDTYFHYTILHATRQILKAVAKALSHNKGLESKDWIRICESLNDVRRFAIHHSAMLLPIMEKVMIVIVKAMKNPRSALCKTSIMAAADIFSAYADTLMLDETLTAESFDQLLLQLLLKASQDKKFVCEEADRALKSTVVSMNPLPQLHKLQKYVNHTNLWIRAKASVSFSNCISKMGLDGAKKTSPNWQSLRGRGDTYKDLLLNVV